MIFYIDQPETAEHFNFINTILFFSEDNQLQQLITQPFKLLNKYYDLISCPFFMVSVIIYIIEWSIP